MSTVKISIIIPVYNKIRYLESLLKMVTEQSFRDFECILIDDGSTDGSGQVCDSFSKIDERFFAIHTSNCGVSHARNVGLDKSIGEYITFIDSDDEITKDYLENLYECILKSGTDIVIGGHAEIWDDKDDIIPAKNPYKAGVYHLTDILSDFAYVQREFGIYGWCWSKLLSRKLIGTSRFTEGLTLAEDFAFYLNIYSRVDLICFDVQPNYLYRQEAENCSVVKDDDAIDYLAQLRVNLQYRSYLRDVGGWSGVNKEIVEQLLSNYVFFVMFHSSADDFDRKFFELYKICQIEKIILKPSGYMQKLLLWMLIRKWKFQAKSLMNLYRYIRKLAKSNHCINGIVKEIKYRSSTK